MRLGLSERMQLFRRRIRPDAADPPSRWLPRHRLWLGALAATIAAVALLDAWLATCGFEGCPGRSEIRAFKPAEGGQIMDRNGKFIGRLEHVRRVNVPLSDVPEHVQQAFIATEDRRFYEHNGLDWRGFGRAAVRNVGALQVREGFSTITMQVARNAFLSHRYSGRSLKRKLVELRLTRLIERELSKEQILEHYLNVIYLGAGMNGVEAASRDLFGKSASKLTLSEGALLAALPKAPSRYTPRRNPKLAVERRDLVLGLMAREEFITDDAMERARKAELKISPDPWRPSQAQELLALDIIRAIVDSVLPDVLQEGDVIVRTTLDETAQRAADRAVTRQAQAIERSSGRAGLMQGALVAMDPQTGDIRAIVGGRRMLRGGFNRAFNARRQPGSAFKPFVYAAAISGGLSPASLVDDEPIDLMIGNRMWSPANYDHQYFGRITLRRALTHSANAAAVRISRAVGEPNVINAARRNGIRSDLQPVPAIALGALEVTPIELVTAYAPFANGGLRVKPRLVTRVEAPDGTVLWSSDVEREQVMDPRDAYEMTSMLRAVVDYGTGRPIRAAGITAPVAGKTGTTNDATDVWFVGYTPSLVAGVWFGYDERRTISNGASGGRFAAPAWADFYKNGWREPRNNEWIPPDGMIGRVIDPVTGELANEWCPSRTREWFKPGSEPTLPCREHSAPIIWHADADDGYSGGVGGRAGDPWYEDVRREVNRALRRIIRF
jgi:1A family penicillin-binding protein